MGSKRMGTLRVQALVNAAVNDYLLNANIIPAVDGAVDLGSPTKHWGNIHTQDLLLRNERGSYTIIEEEEYLSIKNNKNGKLYKFVVQEINENGKEVGKDKVAELERTITFINKKLEVLTEQAEDSTVAQLKKIDREAALDALPKKRWWWPWTSGGGK
jgi:hypothetical protein